MAEVYPCADIEGGYNEPISEIFEGTWGDTVIDSTERENGIIYDNLPYDQLDYDCYDLVTELQNVNPTK